MEFSIIRVLVGTYHLTPYFVYIPSALIPATFVFFFNKHVTFKAEGQTTEQTRRFVLVYVIAFIVNYLLSSFFFTLGSAHILGTSIGGILWSQQRVAYLAKAMGIGITAVFNYTFSHFFIFCKPEEEFIPETAVF